MTDVVFGFVLGSVAGAGGLAAYAHWQMKRGFKKLGVDLTAYAASLDDKGQKDEE